MDNTGRSERIIEEIGCGPFQIVISIVLFTFIKISSLFTFIFMSYGNYNPGWRCLDNDTTTATTGLTNSQIHLNNSDVTSSNLQQTQLSQAGNYLNNSRVEYSKFSKDLTCDLFQACSNVQFNPESSTIVTEWGLVCDRAWISSLIISIQMAGNLVGSFFSGQAADTFGRKKTLYGSLLANIILTFASIFSTSWEIFATFRFLIGIDSAFFESLNYVYPAEFLSRRWRGPMMGIPGWAIGGIIFGVVTMLLKDWKHLLIASCVVYAISFIPVLWVPESLRWLEVKHKTKQFIQAANKMANINRKTLEKFDNFDTNTVDKSCTPVIETVKTTEKPSYNYNVFDLFRPGYRCISLIIAIGWMILSIVFYSLSFGIKALNGNFYLNLIIIYTIFIPFMVFPIFSTNLLGRRRASYTFSLASAVCTFSAMVLELTVSGNVQIVSVLIFVIFGMICIETSWTSQQVHLTELYPTVVRALAMNWANVMSRIGGIAAPFIIPRDGETVYGWYLIMGCMSLLSCCLFVILPETKGKPLKETFEDNGELVVTVNGGDDEKEEE